MRLGVVKLRVAIDVQACSLYLRAVTRVSLVKATHLGELAHAFHIILGPLDPAQPRRWLFSVAIHSETHRRLIAPGEKRRPAEDVPQYLIDFASARRAKPLDRPQTRLFTFPDQKKTHRGPIIAIYDMLEIMRRGFAPTG